MFVCVETWGENFFVPKIKRKVTLCKRRGGGGGGGYFWRSNGCVAAIQMGDQREPELGPAPLNVKELGLKTMPSQTDVAQWCFQSGQLGLGDQGLSIETPYIKDNLIAQ